MRYLVRKRLQTTLLIVGIALGVAVVVAIDFSNETAKKALDLSVQSLLGNSTHQIISTHGLINEEVFVNLVKQGESDSLSPIVEGYVSVPAFDSKSMLIFGIDPLLDFNMRNIYGNQTTVLIPLINSIAKKGNTIISSDIAEKYGLNLNKSLEIEFEGKQIELVIVGIISNEDPLIRQSLNGLLITDISTAQEILGKVGFIDKIDVVFHDENKLEKIAGLLPKDILIISSSEQRAQVENMVSAFQLNLSALSLLAMVVGLFLIYNTMTFSVIQRRELIGVYRGFGFYRSEIFLMILFEALIIALIGTTIGLLSGIILGRQTVNLILQTINDLYYTTTVQDVGLPVISIVKGLILGIFATIIVAIPPAIESTRVSPRNAELRSGLELKTRLSINRLMFLAILSFLLGIAQIFLPIFQKNLWWTFSATFFIVVGFSLLTAVSLNFILPKLANLTRRLVGLFPSMAIRELYRSLSRSSIAISSLMVAVSVTMGMTIMIESFRTTVEIWLKETLVGDIYISVPDQFTNQSNAVIDGPVMDELLKFSDIRSFHTLATVYQYTTSGNIQMNVITNENIGFERLFEEIDVPKEKIWDSLRNGAILMSEPLANRLNLHVGDSLELDSPNGVVNLPVIGIFFDYASNQGHLIMSKDTYDLYWDQYGVTAISIYVKSGKDIPSTVNALIRLNQNQTQKLIIRDNKTLQNDALEVFDRTFEITNALRFIATIIAIIGIYGSVLLILEDRKKEIGILKALGVKPGEFWNLLITETGLMGLFAGIFAIPTGYVVSLILVYVINLRSFGWTIQFHFDWLFIVQALILSTSSAILAGIFPIIRINQLETIKILRDE
ncbi:MAG: FtsX-like permease family protein [Anaerolineaceae bacterium]